MDQFRWHDDWIVRRRVFKALIVEGEITASAVVHEALADAGCVDLETVSLDDAIELVTSRSGLPDLIVLELDGPTLPRLYRLARAERDVPAGCQFLMRTHES